MHIRKNRTLRIKRIAVCLLAFSVAAAAMFVYVDYRLRMTARQFAMSCAKTTIINCANRAASNVLDEMDITYDSLAVVSKDEQGRVTSVEIDTVAINSFKSRLSDAVARELENYESVTFQIPIGAAFGYYFSHFSMPKLSYTMQLTTTAGSDFKSNFYSAGINQVLHQIIIEVRLESGLAMPGYNTDLSTSTSFIAAQTVIVGTVPEAYTNVIDTDDGIVGDIFDYGATID